MRTERLLNSGCRHDWAELLGLDHYEFFEFAAKFSRLSGLASFSETQQDSPREKVELAENSREGRTARAQEGARDTFFIATALLGAVVNFEEVAAHGQGREFP